MPSKAWSIMSATLRRSSLSPAAKVQGLWIMNSALSAISTRCAPQAATLPALKQAPSIRAVQRSPRARSALWMAMPSKRSPPMVSK